MKILNKQEFQKLLEDNPKKKFIFFEYSPTIFLDQLHITTGEPDPTFGAITIGPPDTQEDTFVFEYDWSLTDYSEEAQFAILDNEEINNLINELQ